MSNITKKQRVRLYFNCIGVPSEYRVSENADIEGAAWLPMVDTGNRVYFDLSPGFGIKDLKCQVRNGENHVSNVKLISIEHVDPYTPLVFKTFVINGGESLTYDRNAKVALAYEGEPTHYRMGINLPTIADGENYIPQMGDIGWSEFGGPIFDITLNPDEINNVSVQLRDVMGESGLITKAVKCETLEYVTGEIKIDVTGITSVDDVDIEIPVLKYNKKFVFGTMCDDTMISGFSKFWRYVNGFEVNNQHNWHMGMPIEGGIPGRELYITDGAGVRHRFNMTNNLIIKNEKAEYGRFKLEGNAVSSNPYLRHEENKLMLDYDSAWCYHNVDESLFVKDNAGSIASGINDLRGYMEAKGYTPSFALGQPDGNKAYIEACLVNDEIRVICSTQTAGDRKNLYDEMDLDKFFFGRYLKDSPKLDEAKAFVDALVQGSEMGTGAWWGEYGCHGYGESNADGKWLVLKEFFDWVYTTYGAGGDDSLWWATSSEMYMYQAHRRYSVIEKELTGGVLTIRVKMPKFRYFTRYELTLLSRALAQKTISESSGSVYGLSSATKDGSLMVNIDMAQRRYELADKYTAIFEKGKDEVSLLEARYFIQHLKPWYRDEFNVRIAILTTPPVLSGVDIPLETTLNTILVGVVKRGEVTHYCVTEEQGVYDWKPFVADTLVYEFEKIRGSHTIYVTLKNIHGISNTLSGSFLFNPAEFDIVTPVINGGESTTTSGEVMVVLGSMGMETPEYMKIWEGDVVPATWSVYSNMATYTISPGYGVKTIKAQLKSGDKVTSVKSATIELVEIQMPYCILRGGLAWNDPNVASPNTNPRLIGDVCFSKTNSNILNNEGKVMGKYLASASITTTWENYVYNANASVVSKADIDGEPVFRDEVYTGISSRNSHRINTMTGFEFRELAPGGYDVEIYFHSSALNAANVVDIRAGESVVSNVKVDLFYKNNGENLYRFENVTVGVDGIMPVLYANPVSNWIELNMVLVKIKKI